MLLGLNDCDGYQHGMSLFPNIDNPVLKGVADVSKAEYLPRKCEIVLSESVDPEKLTPE